MDRPQERPLFHQNETCLRACQGLQDGSGALNRLILSDEQWERMAPDLPGKVGHPGRSAADKRMFLHRVLRIVQAGAASASNPLRGGASRRRQSKICSALRFSAGETAKRPPTVERQVEKPPEGGGFRTFEPRCSRLTPRSSRLSSCAGGTPRSRGQRNQAPSSPKSPARERPTLSQNRQRRVS